MGITMRQIQRIKAEGEKAAVREAIASRLNVARDELERLLADDLEDWKGRMDRIGRFFQDAHTLWRAIPDTKPKKRSTTNG